jgi:hypothetical protein
MLWNENADYDVIYPYVAADSIGGDMKFENYTFSGGYAKSLVPILSVLPGTIKPV